jgi:hypothetical protein
MVPFAVGLATLHEAQALASHLLPTGAFGLYEPNTWYPKLSELPAVASVEIGQEHIISFSWSRALNPGNL